MRRITVWFLSTLSALVLLFSYPTSRHATASVSALATADAPTGTTATPTPSDPSASESSASGTQTYDGDTVMTRWGPVQVQITVADGKLVSADVLKVPWENRKDQQINGYAVPLLNASALAAQSANIDMVSGATVTSVGYQQSLQSAIDQAHLS